MTFEEMQQIIQGMLAVQQELQTSQITLKQEISDLKDISLSHERRLSTLVGYSISQETDRLDLAERLSRLEGRVTRLEQEENGS